MELTAGQAMIVSITSEAATAWAKSMMRSWKSYTNAEREIVIALSLANAIRSVADDNSEALKGAIEALSS